MNKFYFLHKHNRETKCWDELESCQNRDWVIWKAIKLCNHHIAEVQKKGRRANIECIKNEKNLIIRAVDSKNVIARYMILNEPTK